MAEPARKIYDDESEGNLSARERANERWGLSPDSLKNAEDTASDPSYGNIPKDEAGLATDPSDTIGSGYKEEGRSGKSTRGIFTKKRTLIGGVIASVLIIGNLSMFSMLHGPWQIFHLSQNLGKFSRFSDNASAARTKGFLKWHRFSQTGDIGETRVGVLGSRRYGNVISRLESRGITFERSTRGHLTGIKIDEHTSSKLKGASRAQTQANIARQYNVPVNQVVYRNGAFHMDARTANARQTRLLAASSLELIDDGKIQTAMNKRIIGKFWGAPSLFHPLRKGAEDLQKKWDTRAARKTAERERKNKDSKRAKLKGNYVTAKESLARKLGPASGAFSAALTLTGGLCIIKEAADIIPLVNYAQVEVPAMEESIDIMAVGSQMMAMDDYYFDQLGGVVEGLSDNEGGTVWGGRALNALAYGGGGRGEDISPAFRQAFIYEGGSIEGLFNAINGSPDQTVGEKQIDEEGNVIETVIAGTDEFAKAACSPLGYAAQISASVALVAIGPGGWIVKGAQAGGSAAVMAGIMYVVKSVVADNLTTEMMWESLSAEQKGNLWAYAARALANLNATSMGGIALSNSEELELWAEFERQDLEEFQKKSFFARVFDVYDHRSVAANFIQSAHPDPMQNISSIASGILNPIKIFTSSFASLFSSKLHADEGSYDWGFPVYSIPTHILEDPKYEDPYENADEVAALLNNNSVDVDRAKACFGVEFKHDSDNRWDVIQVEAINPKDKEYLGGSCDDLSEEDWARTMLFVFDTTLMTTIDCYEGGVESCAKLGLAPTVSSGFPIGGELSDLECPAGLEAHPSQTGYYRMPSAAPNGEYTVYSPAAKRWGSRELICVLHTVGLAYNEAMQGTSKLSIGNLNTPYRQPSVSHRWGVASDLSARGQIQAASHNKPEKGRYSKDATVLIGKLLVDTGKIKNIWWCDPGDSSTQEIKEYAQSKGTPVNIKCQPGHKDHFHIDLKDEYKLQLYSP